MESKYPMLMESQLRLRSIILNLLNLKTNPRIKFKPYVSKDVYLDVNKDLVNQKFIHKMYMILPTELYTYLEDLLGSLSAEIGVMEGLFSHYKDDPVLFTLAHNFKNALFDFQSFLSEALPISQGEIYAFSLNLSDYMVFLQRVQVQCSNLLGHLESFDCYLRDLDNIDNSSGGQYVKMGSESFKALA